MLVNCVAYRDGRKLADIAVEEISDHLKKPETFVWVALKDPLPEELARMQEEFGLHELAVEDAQHWHQRPKIEEYGDSLFVVLQVPQLVEDDLRVGEVDLFVGRNYVLSVRHDTEPGFRAVRERAENEPELLAHGAGFVFYALMDNVVDRYFPIVDRLEVRLEDLENRIFGVDGSHRENIEQLYDLKHYLTTMRHAVEPLIEVVHKLFGGRVPPVCQGVQDYFRDIYDHLLRVSQTIDGLRDMVSTALSVNISMINMASTEVTKRLAAYAALVAVPTMIAGVYGMNFEFMPELKSPWGYPVTLAVMLAIDGWLFYRFRKIGWL
jgi:magnesium transporter